MGLELYADKLPEDIREGYKTEVQKYVMVDSREAAKSLIGSNQHFSAEFQSALSLAHENSMKKFNAEKLPALIDEEIKKRGTKQPWEIEIENLRNENKEIQKQGILKDRKSQAISELSKIGLDADLADFLINEDEAIFKANIEKLTGKVISWRDKAIQKLKTEVFSQREPEGGKPADPSKIMTRAAFESLDPAAKMAARKAGAVIVEG